MCIFLPHCMQIPEYWQRLLVILASRSMSSFPGGAQTHAQIKPSKWSLASLLSSAFFLSILNPLCPSRFSMKITTNTVVAGKTCFKADNSASEKSLRKRWVPIRILFFSLVYLALRQCTQHSYCAINCVTTHLLCNKLCYNTVPNICMYTYEKQG